MGNINILSIDIGGTYIKYGLYNTDTHQLTHVDALPTPTHSFEALAATINSLKKQFEEHLISGIAFSLPGTIHADSGLVIQGGALQYNNQINFIEVFKHQLNCPVSIENDARCAALAELWKGNLKNVQNGLVLVIGTGLGGAIIQNGTIYAGAHRYAGELSMIVTKSIRKYGAQAVLGNQVSIPLFIQHMSQKIGKSIEGPELFQLIEDGHPELNKEFQKYLDNFVQQIFNFQISYDPEQILIGGGISRNQFFMDRLVNTMENFYQLLPIQIPHAKLKTCKFKNNANLIGAVKHYLDSIG
ncbi:ROK family protein [Vagococcus elongatus]|uniref:ROK family protein n=1 Tax=Vagococcus elongatus TaxID=180344 RepID=A0A430ALE2_9ENTE|nr:ROK family protein [Vagococcus elongatus]RSU08928.1 hypothetical protein CBF29_12770 [Vagococcus elongatus]